MNMLFVAVLLTTSLRSASAADLDRRFEGTWKGVETLQVNGNVAQRGEAPEQKPAIIAIGEAGRTLGVVQGLYPGRYAVSPKWVQSWRGVSGGNTLVFATFDRPTTMDCRDVCKLVLSADGNTAEVGGETGQIFETKAFGAVIGSTGKAVEIMNNQNDKKGNSKKYYSLKRNRNDKQNEEK